MSVYADPIQVYPQIEQWKFDIIPSGISGTRVFLETTTVLDGLTKQNLPRLGDYWDSDYTNVTCKHIGVTYLNNDESCGRKFTCDYDGAPYLEEAIALANDELPTNLDIGGELISWEPRGSTAAVWDGTTTALTQTVFLSVGIATVRQTRVINDLDTYNGIVMSLVNKINKEVWRGFPIGTVMFIGASEFEYRNKMGAKRWKVELQFQVRTCTGNYTDNNDGWNFLLDENTGTWKKPRINGNLIYAETSFDKLYEGSLGEQEDLYQHIPDK